MRPGWTAGGERDPQHQTPGGYGGAGCTEDRGLLGGGETGKVLQASFCRTSVGCVARAEPAAVRTVF